MSLRPQRCTWASGTTQPVPITPGMLRNKMSGPTIAVILGIGLVIAVIQEDHSRAATISGLSSGIVMIGLGIAGWIVEFRESLELDRYAKLEIERLRRLAMLERDGQSASRGD